MSPMDETRARYLVDSYADMILRISYMYLKSTYDAEDICQDVLMKCLAHDQRFETDEHERRWIIRTTINACKDHLRIMRKRRHMSIDAAAWVAAPEEPESQLLEHLKKLPENYRISLYLHYYEGYRVGEIAELLGKSENTVSAHLSRGRKRLRTILEQEQRGAYSYEH